MDPNLVQLAAAYREAKAQLGDDAVLPADGDSADEENMSANANGIPGVAEDAHEGLNAGGVPPAHTTGAGSVASAQRRVLPAESPDSNKVLAAKLHTVDGRSNGLQARTQRNSAARAGQGRNFIPADAFGGARPDYVFQTGSQGTGYYSDAVGAAAVSRSRRKAVGAAESAGETQEGVPARLDGSAAASGDGNAGGRAERKPDADDSDSEDDRGAKGRRRGVQTGIGQKVKGERKALPGRLRKKLARDREKHRSKLAN